MLSYGCKKTDESQILFFFFSLTCNTHLIEKKKTEMQTPPVEQTAREAAVGLEHLWAPAAADKVLASHRERPEALQA